MGPHPIRYQHPWIQEQFFTRDADSCIVYFRYPEMPSHGFYVQSITETFFYVGPIKWEDESTPVRSGTAEIKFSEDSVTNFLETMRVSGLSMIKVHNIEELGVAPF